MDINGDSLGVKSQIEFSDDDSTTNTSKLNQSKFFYRIIDRELEQMIPRRSIIDRTITLPRTIWNKLYSPLGTLVMWGEHAELKRKLFGLFLNENETAGFYPNLSLGGETGTSIGGVLFHNNLLDKNVKVNLEGLFAGDDYISTNFNLSFPINNGKQNIFAEIGWKIDDEEDFFIGNSFDYLGTNNSIYSESERLYGYEQIKTSVIIELFRFKSKESLIIHQTGYRETYRKTEVFGGILYKSKITDVDAGSDYRVVIPSDVPGYGKINLNSFGGFITIDARNHPTRPFKGWLFSISDILSQQSNGNEYSFNKLAIEIQVYKNLYKQNRILVVRVKYEKLNPINGDRVPFYELSTLGTTETLRGYKRSRFRDLGSLLANIEYRYPLWDTLDGVVFYDTGQVFEESSKVSIRGFHNNIGTGLRFMSNAGYIARVQIAYSQESVRALLKFTQVF